MDKGNALSAISQYVKKQHVLTLCVGHNSEIWCASCFYTYNENEVAFYLMTETTTRHGEMMLLSPNVVGTISGQPKTVMRIKGIQFCGRIVLLQGEEAQVVRKRYTQRFPVARGFTAPIWRLWVDEAKMTDNTLGFGTKRYWRRSDDPAG